MLSATPIVVPHPVLLGTTSQPLDCYPVTRSATGASGMCYQRQTTTLNTALITAGITVVGVTTTTCPVMQLQIIAAEPTQ